MVPKFVTSLPVPAVVGIATNLIFFKFKCFYIFIKSFIKTFLFSSKIILSTFAKSKTLPPPNPIIYHNLFVESF